MDKAYVENLEKRIGILENSVRQLEGRLSRAAMPLELKEIIRSEVVKDIDSVTAVTRTQEIELADLPVTLTLPINPTGLLVLKATSGREYKVFYV